MTSPPPALTRVICVCVCARARVRVYCSTSRRSNFNAVEAPTVPVW
jgi:hypothetical protein